MRFVFDPQRIARRLAMSGSLLLAIQEIGHAQSMGMVTGTVLADSSGRPVAGARVTLDPGGREVRTDSAGNFMLASLLSGRYTIAIRAVGYAPLTTRFSLEPGQRFEADFSLRGDPQRLETVDIKANADARLSGNNPRIAEFDARRKSGIGHFLVQADFARAEGRKLADVLRSRWAGVSIMSYANRSVLISTHGAVSLGGGPILDPMDRKREARPRCFVQIILDDVLLYTGYDREPLFDVNSIDPSRLAAAEFYTVAERPAQFTRGTSGACGTLVLWSRY